MAGLTPDATVVVATVRALALHGGAGKKNATLPQIEYVQKGLPNLMRHVHNMKEVYGLPCVVAVNRFPTDTDAELDLIDRTSLRRGGA